MSIDATVLPSELLVTPLPLVGFFGLDTSRNSLHKTIWEAFSSNRKSDRAAVQFKLLPPNYEFPVAKKKRASYEWYHPNGILKRNWMLKHLHVLPAVVVLFYDIEWNDALWTEKQLQCASLIQSLKNALQERNTRLCLVLLQKSAPLPPGEDLLAAERATSLTTACGINSKMLFILPHTEHLMGYTMRLESAFLDMAQSYYTLMSKRIRTHRDQLTAAHTTLKIRHQFKLGFVAEMRQDFSTALKHYTQAYAGLDEIRITDTNCLEIKTLAGFLNYKICRLMFKLKVPRDAINHFISHIEKYKHRVGFKDLAFEHHAWLSTQHSVFAELFCEAIKNGLPALQTQHPGIYFHKAAEYIVKRRDAAQEAYESIQSDSDTTTNKQNNTTTLYTEFFGIRSIKTGDLATEQQINAQLCQLERSFNHSAAIIALLSQAMAQFKIYKCLRFRKKLAIDMAGEYLKSGDNAKALTLYSLMLPDYRQEKWSTIFTEVLLRTLRCALLSASIADFVSCSIEALSLAHHSEQKERIMVLENLWQVFQGIAPIPKGNQAAHEMRELWQNAFVTVKSPIQIDLDKVSNVLDMCATFEKLELSNNEIIKVYLIARVLTDVPLRIRNFWIVLSDGSNNYKLEVKKYLTFGNLLGLREYHQTPNDSRPSAHKQFEQNLRFEPDLYYQLVFTTETQQFLENTQLRITRIEAQMGTEKLNALLTRSSNYTRNAFRHHTRNRDLDDNLKINPFCYIAPTFHLVTQTNIDNDSTMLVNEYYSVVTTVSNPHNVYLQNVGINICVPPQLRNSVFLTTDISSGRQKLHSQIQIDVGELSMQSSNTVTYYIFSLTETTVTLKQKLCYTMEVEGCNSTAILSNASTPLSTENSPENGAARQIAHKINTTQLTVISPVQIEHLEESRLRKTREDLITIKCALDFNFNARFYTFNRQPLTRIYRGENFLLRTNAEVMATHNVDILEAFFICDHNLVQSNYSFKRKKFTNEYTLGDTLEDVIVLRTNAANDDWLNAKNFERSKGYALPNRVLSRFQKSKCDTQLSGKSHHESAMNNSASGPLNDINAYMNKNLMAKIPTTMTIINNNAAVTNALLLNSSNQATTVMCSSTNSEDGKNALQTSQVGDAGESSATAAKSANTRLIYNKALEGIMATGHLRGFIKAVYTAEQQVQDSPNFGVYCIRWRRHGSKEENESKFVISGLEIVEPPLNIYCTIEEKMFVKIPMTFKILLKNPTSKVLHLISTLSISNTDNFICSGHKQLDISIMAFDEKELVYNLYPLRVGWQNLPELTLEYNMQADPNKNENQNALLCELVQRALPKRVFVLPPLKQQNK